MSDDGEDEEELVYEFVAAGEHSCERCQALNGSQWHTPPNPPHAHCECEIQVKPSGLHRPRSCGDSTWSMTQLQGGTVHYDSNDPSLFEWGFAVTIDCWDGLVYEFEIWVDMGSQDDYGDMFADPEGWSAAMSAFAWSEVFDEAEAVLAQVCRPCQPELVS